MDIHKCKIDAGDARGGALIFERGEHRWLWLGLEEHAGDEAVQANQYAIVDHGRAVLLDPGSFLNFGQVVATLGRYIDIDAIDHIVCSHQDPDVSSAISMWQQLTPARVHISSIWTRFLPHFGQLD